MTTPSGTGYSVASGLPIIKGFIKIEMQTAYGNPCGTWKDVTLEVLSYGYAGRNIYPQGSLTSGTQYGTSEPLLALPTTQVASPYSSGFPCSDDVHPNAIIRLERVRDNPSNWTTANPCGVTVVANKVTAAPTNPADYWPNALFDTREGTSATSSLPAVWAPVPISLTTRRWSPLVASCSTSKSMPRI